MLSKGQSRTWTCSTCSVLKRRSRLTLSLVLLACLVVLVVAHQLLLLAYTYNDYIMAAILPRAQLPQQTRVLRPRTTGKEGPGGEGEHGAGAGNVKDKPPRILCLISTSPKYHESRARHVVATWSSHCSRAVFLTTSEDSALPEVVLTLGAAGYDQLWDKVTQGFEWAYGQLGSFEWVVKADDDSFVVVENLRAAVMTLDPETPVATGVHLRTWETGETYLNGGASYVLSRSAVRRLVEQGLKEGRCRTDLELGTNEDVNMAACLSLLGVGFLDSRDSEGRQRFHIYPPQKLVDPRQEGDLKHLWLKRISIYPYKFGYGELSDEVISFHYVDAETMYLIYYLIYLVNPPVEPDYRSPLKPLPEHRSKHA